MYREPRSLALTQRIVSWVQATRYSFAPPRVQAVDADQRRVALCARHLEISEFDVFARAYHAWYGRSPAVRDLEREFCSFVMLRCDLPFYVRRFLGRVDTLLA